MMWCLLWLCILVPALSSTVQNCSQSWLHLSDDGYCMCGPDVYNAVLCNNETRQVRLQLQYCMTFDGEGSNISVIGNCMPSLVHRHRKITGPDGYYYKIEQNRFAQQEKTCSYTNRQGRLCSQCKSNHTVSAYSYTLECYHCESSTWSSVLQYIAFAFVPLSIFLVVVMVFRISITSPALNMPVVCCQFLSSPFIINSFLSSTRDSDMFNFVRFLATVYGIWNLDLFRALVPPVCLPLDALQVVALDYLVAVYPLLLLICFHRLISARDRGFKPVVRLCRPFLWCSRQLRNKDKIQSAIKDAFISFLLLSQIKLFNTSFSLLVSTSICDEHGNWLGRFHAKIRVMSYQHRPYCILAISIILVLVLLPTLLQLLYPMLWFQRLLNRLRLNRPGLRLCMESFQGYYRDRTDGGLDCRYFSTAYPTIRVIYYVAIGTVHGFNMFAIFNVLGIITAGIILIVRPYKPKYRVYHTFDALMMLALAVFAITLMEVYVFIDARNFNSSLFVIMAGALSLTPLLYFIVRSIMYIFTTIRVLVSRTLCV